MIVDSVSLSICLFVSRMVCKYHWFALPKISEDGSWTNRNPFKFVSDLAHLLHTKSYPVFHIYLLLHALVKVCTLCVPFFILEYVIISKYPQVNSTPGIIFFTEWFTVSALQIITLVGLTI